jgi:hypothetical protein
MRRLCVVGVLALLVAGCVNQPSAPTIAWVQGPKFAAWRFYCGRHHPAPPDPDKIAAEQIDRAAANYEVSLDAWGRSCRDRLRSVGAELRAAGQVREAAPEKRRAKE